MTLDAINPATGERLARYDEMTPVQATEIIGRAHQAFVSWRLTSFADRATAMRRAAALLRRDRSVLARLAALEMGKPVTGGKAEVEKCAWVCDYYADHAERFLDDEPVATDAARSFVTFQPLGVILAVMPWNFPFWQVFRFAAPALMAGNAGVLKHASNVPGCALAIERSLDTPG